MADEEAGWLRLDKFLVFARFCKTRSVATALVEKGAVRINRQNTDKPHAKLHPGDSIDATVVVTGDKYYVTGVRVAR